jgi:hypothetical protein
VNSDEYRKTPDGFGGSVMDLMLKAAYVPRADWPATYRGANPTLDKDCQSRVEAGAEVRSWLRVPPLLNGEDA